MRHIEPMKCKNCKREINYNYHYHCYECYNCGKVYNINGSELAPVDHWRDEYDVDDDY